MPPEFLMGFWVVMGVAAALILGFMLLLIIATIIDLNRGY